jgi:uncharacterized membrane protein
MSFCQSCGTALSDNGIACAVCAGQASAGVAVAAMPAPASTGLQNNAVGALAYLGGWITGILFLVIEPYKADRFVRFHSLQSIFFNIAWAALWIVWMILGFVLGAMTKGVFFLIEMPINLLLMIGGFCLWAYLMYSAYQNKTFKLPIIGALAAKQAGL